MQIHRTSCGKKNTNKHNWGVATLSEKLHYPIGLVCWGKCYTMLRKNTIIVVSCRFSHQFWEYLQSHDLVGKKLDGVKPKKIRICVFQACFKL